MPTTQPRAQPAALGSSGSGAQGRNKKAKNKKKAVEMFAQVIRPMASYKVIPPQKGGQTSSKRPVSQASQAYASQAGPMRLMGNHVPTSTLSRLAQANHAGSVALLTMLPERGTFRYSGPYTAAMTVRARPFSVSNYDFNQPYTVDTSSPIEEGTTRCFLRRSALQMLISWRRNNQVAWTAESRRYEGGVELSYQTISSGGATLLDFTHFYRLTGSKDVLPTRMYNPTHNDPGVGEFRAMYVNATSNRPTNIVVARAAAATAQWEITVYRMDGTEWVQVLSPVFPAVDTDLQIPVSTAAYYAVEINAPVFDPAEVHQVHVGLVGTCDCWRIEPMPGLEDQLQSFTNIRVNAASLLLSPNCAESERSGRCDAVQIPSGTVWTSFTTPSLGSMPDSTTMTFVKGAFGFLKPSSVDSYSLRDIIHRDNSGSIVSIQERLVLGCDTLAFALSVPMGTNASLASPSYPASNIHLTCVTGMEYTSTSSWLTYGTPELSPETFADSLSIIRDLPQFFENETHGEAILRFLRNGVEGVLKYGPTVLQIASYIASLL